MPSKYVTRIKTGAKAPRSYDKMQRELPEPALPSPQVKKVEKRGRKSKNVTALTPKDNISKPPVQVSNNITKSSSSNNIAKKAVVNVIVELHMECTNEPLSDAQVNICFVLKIFFSYSIYVFSLFYVLIVFRMGKINLIYFF